jgi:hypothetical protein
MSSPPFPVAATTRNSALAAATGRLPRPAEPPPAPPPAHVRPRLRRVAPGCYAWPRIAGFGPPRSSMVRSRQLRIPGPCKLRPVFQVTGRRLFPLGRVAVALLAWLPV